MFNKQWAVYIGLLLALFAVVASALNWLDPTVAWGLAGIFGFGSIGVLRSYMESKGWLTYASVGIPTILGVLLLLGVIDVDTYKILISAFAPLTGLGIARAVNKELKSTSY